MYKYLITGANGFCGRHIVEVLNHESNKVYGVSRYIPDELILCYPEVTYEQCNLMDHTSVFNLLKRVKPDYIFHLAAESSVASSWKSPINILNNNIQSQINIFEAVRELELPTRILVACSSEEYGLINESDLPVDEKCNFNPLSTYAVSKVSQDMLAYQYYKSYNMDIVRVRSFNLTGPGRPHTYALSSFAYQIAKIEKNISKNMMLVGNLDVTRDYTDVRDAVKGYYKIALEAKPGTVYNLCSGKAYNLKDLLNILISFSTTEVNVEIDSSKYRPSDLPIMLGDNTKIKTEIGWIPEIDIHTSLNDLLNYWRNYKV
ncbi:NAD-dependent epimerase/dehydratase family protein [Methanohalophilus sp. RSK]|uniref:GDP-mannose 4,6-dehydratase n=1 Tax=Methanohalophilus sp. RSK TaxID=2485783 RepID=UPI000F43BA49|nr:GDP-mannose 4,6-dehydratase [Methanohalophilus sp. RSK]RNI15809.1 NAD-dependent epimerase/dehydratase family protein [Methanohalophilus sp. RSK]